MFSDVYKFNSKARLLDHGYSDIRESAYGIEEMLEGFNLGVVADSMRRNAEFLADNSPREVSLEIVNQAASGFDPNSLTDVDRVDKHVDSIIYSLGSLYKLGLNEEEAIEAIQIVAKANLQKLTAGKDEHGKQMKPEGFIPPEEALAELLERVHAP